jgi:hypothetical protein
MAAETDPGSSTLLDVARDFSTATAFPVRTANNLGGNLSMTNLVVIPAVLFRGTSPAPLYLPPTYTWTGAADFLSDDAAAAGADKVQTVDVVKDFDVFISGVGKQAMVGGQLGSTFTLGATQIGVGGLLDTDVGVRAPAVVNLFGTPKVISQINHEFTNSYYRSSLELAPLAEVT